MRLERSGFMEEYEAQTGRPATEMAEGCEFAREEYVVWLEVRLEEARRLLGLRSKDQEGL